MRFVNISYVIIRKRPTAPIYVNFNINEQEVIFARTCGAINPAEQGAHTQHNSNS